MHYGFRKGKAKDSKAIAEMIYSSGPESFDFMHFNKENALKYIQFEFKTSLPSFFGHTYAWVCEDLEGNVIASSVPYGVKENFWMTIGTVLKTIAFYKFKSSRPLRRLSVIGKMVKPPKKGEWFLSCFGVKETMRGQGIGEFILRQQMKWAKENGYKSYGLYVSEKNPRAKLLYKRMGLTEKEHKISLIKKVPNFYKMERVF